MVVWSLSYPISTMMIEIFARKGLSRRIYQLVPPKYQMFKHLWRYLYLFRPHSLNHEWLPWINHNLSSLPRNGWMLSLLIEKGIVLAKDIQRNTVSAVHYDDHAFILRTHACETSGHFEWPLLFVFTKGTEIENQPIFFLLFHELLLHISKFNNIQVDIIFACCFGNKISSHKCISALSKNFDQFAENRFILCPSNCLRRMGPADFC